MWMWSWVHVQEPVAALNGGRKEAPNLLESFLLALQLKPLANFQGQYHRPWSAIVKMKLSKDTRKPGMSIRSPDGVLFRGGLRVSE